MSTEKTQKYSNEIIFIEFLEELLSKKDRAALATLRRGLGKQPGEAMELYRYIGRFITGLSYSDENAYFLIATLFGLYPCESWRSSNEERYRTNLGSSLRLLKDQLNSDSIERRFVALLNSHRDDLPFHLRQIIGLLKSKEISIDWLQLLQALRYWDLDKTRRTQRDWAKSFWQEDRV
jgi:CRISPR system Cascade subunit CasB